MDSKWRRWGVGLVLDARSDAGVAQPQPVALDDLRSQLVATLRDCEGPMSERMRWRLEAARSAHDLWLLRAEVFQLIAGQHCQAVAAARINALVPAFEGQVPARFLTCI